VLGRPSSTRTLLGPRSLWRYFYFDMIKRKLWLLTLLLAWLTTPALLIGQDLNTEPPDEALRAPPSRPVDFNKDIYYKNKLEFSLETGALPINIPFVFDVFVGGDYSQRPLHYTLVPIFPSLRWHMSDVKGPWILRGNTDLTATLSVTAIPRGPEKIYGAFNLGVRRNFVYRNWHSAPYFEFRAGAGFIDAKQPDGVAYAQGQDFTFTLMMGTGARYNFNSRYSMSLGPEYMHVSNLYLSEPKYYNNGINVWGGMIGFNMRLGKPKETATQ
jgi:lipid A 3-O-deacylase PagL